MTMAMASQIQQRQLHLEARWEMQPLSSYQSINQHAQYGI